MGLQAPERLGGRYVLAEPLGYGGMGRVFRAHDALLDRDVAVKLIEDASATVEARAAAGVSHSGVVRIFDVGSCFIVMELVEGRSLRDVLSEHGRLAPVKAAELAAQVADALEAIHQNGLVHCDVKPGNILITRSGMPKLIDFGVAQAAAGPHAEGNNGEIWASAAYLSPEQARGESVDARTDVYALGVVLYELLVGRPPFSGDSAASVAAQRLVAEPLPPYRAEPSIPTALSSIVMRALARDAAHRFDSAAGLRDALRSANGSASEPTQRLPVAPVKSGFRRSAAGVALAAFAAIALLTGWRFAHSDNSLGDQHASQAEADTNAAIPAPQPQPTATSVETAPAAPPTTVTPPQAPARGAVPASQNQGKQKGRGRD
jgi:serine/threonine-protein kinase